MSKKKLGAVTLLMALILITLSTLIVMIAANHGVLMSKSISNQARASQAFEAAQGGLEYGIGYLRTNSSAILANPTGGYINAYTNASTTNVVLPNSSRYSITYTNPIANNYNLIKIESTGTNDDNTATKTVSQLISLSSILVNTPDNPVTSQKSVNLNDNATVRNLSSSVTIQSGSTTTLSNNAQTYLSSGLSSKSGNIKSDITQNISSLSSMTANDFFVDYFGAGIATIKSAANYYYNYSSNHDYSTQVNNITNAVIWIDQAPGTTATIQNNRTLGSPTNPVILIVNGGLTIQDNVTIYGFVFVNGATSTSQNNVAIHGALASTDDLTLRNNFTLNYNPTVLGNFKTQSNTQIIAKVPGSWKDF